MKSLNFTIVYRVMQSKNIIQDIKKCGPAVFRITTGTAKRLIEIQINKQSAPLQVYEQYFFIPFSTMTARPEPRLSNKIGGFVVKGNPKIPVQYFHFCGFVSKAVPKLKILPESAKMRTGFVLSICHFYSLSPLRLY